MVSTAGLPCVQWISDSLEDSLRTRGQLQHPALVAAGNRWRFIGRASLSGVFWLSLRSRAGNDCDVALAQVPPAEDAHGQACHGMAVIIGRRDRPWAVLARLPSLSKRNSLNPRALWDGVVRAPRAIRNLNWISGRYRVPRLVQIARVDALSSSSPSRGASRKRSRNSSGV